VCAQGSVIVSKPARSTAPFGPGDHATVARERASKHTAMGKIGSGEPTSVQLSDKAAIITGGAGGIGRSIALFFAREGAA
jgi:hypothetical protein